MSLYLDKAAPSVWDAVQAFSASVTAAAEQTSLTEAELELLKVYASQLNGCAYCLDLHARAARTAGVPQQKLDLLTAWRDSTLYTKREISLLMIAQAATQLPVHNRSRIELEEARDCLGDEEFAVAQWAAISINTFNRISILSHHPVRARDGEGKLVK